MRPITQARMKSTSQELARAQSRLASYQESTRAKPASAQRREPSGRLSLRLALALGAEQPGAHHRRGRQRDDERDQHRRRKRDRELAEQPPDLAVHEQQRDEHRDQRDADREHGEAHLLRAEQRRLHPVHAGLDVPGGVLEDDDRVVDDEAGGHRERHQAQVVEREAEQVHDREGAEQRDDGRHRRHDGGAQRCAGTRSPPAPPARSRSAASSRSRAARRGSSWCGRMATSRSTSAGSWARSSGRSARTPSTVSITLAPGWRVTSTITAGLPLKSPRVRLFSTSSLTSATSERRTAAPLRQATTMRRVVGGAARRRLGVDLQPPPRALDRALGPVGVRGLDRGAHVLAADAVAVEGEGQQLDPHRRQRAAADLHVADALDLRQPLADDVRHRVVDLARRQRLRGQRQDDHRRVGRIGLAVGRVASARSPAGRRARR